MLLSSESPLTVSMPALNVEVVAAFAGALAATKAAAATADPANSRRAFSRVSFIVSLSSEMGWGRLTRRE